MSGGSKPETERNIKMLESLDKGNDTRAVAREFGVALSCVRTVIRKWGHRRDELKKEYVCSDVFSIEEKEGE